VERTYQKDPNVSQPNTQKEFLENIITYLDKKKTELNGE